MNLFLIFFVFSFFSNSEDADIQILLKHYTQIKKYENGKLIFQDNTSLAFDDGMKKTWKEKLEKADVEDMFFQKYTKGIVSQPIPKNHDPGRIRSEAFFKKIYGSSTAEVEKNLVEITWCPKLIGQTIKVTKINGVSEKLKSVSDELDKHPEFKKYLENVGGTFNWRYIRGTKRLSHHSFGTTIDLHVKYSDYWQWASNSTDENIDIKYKNRIPQEIVEIFEKYGFIWGGKWYHFDTMHFEYRPELLDTLQ